MPNTQHPGLGTQHPIPRSHILIRSTLWNFTSQGWFLILALVATPYIVHKLGTDAYGVLSIVGVAIGYFGFLDLGLGQAVIKYVSEYYAKKDYDTIRKIIGTAIPVYFLMGFVGATVIASLTGLLVTRVLKIPSNGTLLIVLKVMANPQKYSVDHFSRYK